MSGILGKNAKELMLIQKKIKELKAREQELKDYFNVARGDSTVLMIENILITWDSSMRKQLDTAKVKDFLGDKLSDYQKEIEVTMFKIREAS